MNAPTLLRANIFHTPRSPFDHEDALESYLSGALVFAGSNILAVGDFKELSQQHPDASILDYRDAYVIPGMVDTHVHYPQIPVIGAMGLRLLDWLETRTLPAEEKFADVDYARAQADSFLNQLVRNGTTTALVFGAHFASAMDAFFEQADASGLRITAGLNLGDRLLSEALHSTPEWAYAESRRLIDTWHNHGRLRYAVTPRFSLSCSDEMLAVCKRLMQETPDVFFTSHINEQQDEIATVLGLFEGVKDYLETYEKHDLVTERSVFAHNVHVSDRELGRLARQGSSISHCSSSNMFIGSGLFPMQRHLKHGVHFSLGSDVGGGTGFSLLKEGLMAYQTQMLRDDGYPLKPAHLLYLATLAGAQALKLEHQIGDFSEGKQADFVVLQPPEASTLAESLKHSPSDEARLASLFTLAREDCVQAVFIAGEAKRNTVH